MQEGGKEGEEGGEEEGGSQRSLIVRVGRETSQERDSVPISNLVGEEPEKIV